MNKKYIWTGVVVTVILLGLYRYYYPDPKLEPGYKEQLAVEKRVGGQWHLAKTNALVEMNFELKTEGDSTFMKCTFDDQTFNKQPVTLALEKDRTKIVFNDPKAQHGEYYYIEADGNLGLYNAENKAFGFAVRID